MFLFYTDFFLKIDYINSEIKNIGCGLGMIAESKQIVLIVDDQAVNISLLTDILHGVADIYFAQSGTEALSRAAEILPDLILLDIEMPAMNGFAVCQQLKVNPLTCNIPVIFVSAHTEAEFEFHSLAFGAVDYISRPFNRDICRLRVQNHLLLQQQKTAISNSNAALYEEKQRLLVTLESIGDAVIATDINGCITFMNPIAEAMTGWRLAEALGKHIETVMQLRDAGDHQPSINPLLIALKDQRRVAMALNCELVSRDGSSAVAVEDSASPIFDRSNNVIGGIIVFHDVSEARALALKMSYLANHDQLTGLPNRVLLHDRIHQACHIARIAGYKVALLIIDIDSFKFINDSLGHKAGDELIRLLAARIDSILDPEQTLARVGGDEFIVIYPDVVHLELLNIFAKRLTQLMEKPFTVQDKSYSLSISVGISLFPTDAVSEEELMRHADVALHKAKQEGRNGFCFFSDELGQRMLLRHQQEQALGDAIKNHCIEVLFQPKVLLLSGQVIGAEALVRIKAADGSLISPANFIPLAEETGLIVPLGKQVLIKACYQTAKWLAQGIRLVVSVNVAAAQFSDPAFLPLIRQTLAESRLPPELLELELTETALIGNPLFTAEILEKCRQLGIKVAIDDFGTGYSSLGYLKKFKVDVLKIDMSFVKDMLVDKSDEKIVKTIISLGQSMNIRLVAEGIETEAHRDRLLQLGCECGQGYYFSKPLPTEDFMRYLGKSDITNETLKA